MTTNPRTLEPPRPFCDLHHAPSPNPVVAARDKEGNVHVLLSIDLAGPKGNFSGVAVELDKSGEIVSGSFYMKTIQGGNISQIRNSVTAERSKQVSDKDMKEMIPMLQAMAPKNLKITGGSVDGDHATLLATSQDGKELMQGTITMAKESGAWKVEQESWKN